jgi:hypothetical protein
MGPDAETNAIFFKYGKCGQGAEVLPDGQRGNADKVDEL